MVCLLASSLLSTVFSQSVLKNRSGAMEVDLAFFYFSKNVEYWKTQQGRYQGLIGHV